MRSVDTMPKVKTSVYYKCIQIRFQWQCKFSVRREDFAAWKMLPVLKILASSCLFVITVHSAVSDMHSQITGGFLPSPVKYFKQNGDQLAMESQASAVTEDNSLNDRPQQARLGFPLYSATTLNTGYAGSPAVYNPVKLDLGGLLLGTMVGMGAVLLIPKLFHVLSNPYGGGGDGHTYSHYGRSEDGMMSGISEVMARVDEALAQHHINSTACLQRALCSSLQTAQPSALAAVVSSATKNPLVSFLLEGSRLEKAAELGRAGESCAAAFPQCPFNQDSLAAGLDAMTSSLRE